MLCKLKISSFTSSCGNVLTERGRTCVKQAENNKTKASTSNVVVVPVQQEKASSKTTPSLKNSTQTSKAEQSAGKSSDGDASNQLEKQQRLFQTEKSNLEELHQSKVRALEEQITRCKDQLKSQKKDSDTAAAESKKALADVKLRYEKELAAWKQERETMKKTDKQVCCWFIVALKNLRFLVFTWHFSRDIIVQVVLFLISFVIYSSVYTINQNR